jgi:hypothetical protein
MKNEIYLNFEDQKFSDDITYMESNVTLKGKRMDSVVEIDINHAYWKTAHMLGVISDELYQEGADDSKGIGKIARLVALGALAKKKTYYQIVGGKMVKQTVERSELTENIWFTICFNVSRVMQETAVSLDKDYLFYWVDGIYVKNDPEAVDLAVSIFNSNGYSVKKKEIHKIDFDEDHFTVYNSKEDYDMPLGEDGKSKAGVRKFHYVDKNVYNLTKKYVVTARLNEYINSVIKKNRQSK